MELLALLLAAEESVEELLPNLDAFNVGVLAVVVLGLVKGILVPKWVVDRLTKQLDEKDDELEQLRNKLIDEVQPQLLRTTDLLAHLTYHERRDEE